MYDEFGNYIGPDLNVEDDDERSDASSGRSGASSDEEESSSARGGNTGTAFVSNLKSKSHFDGSQM
jgi:116 kDa U5 small nuclear ribonucleoprotein component N-terminus